MFCAEATDTTATEDSRKPDSEKTTAMVLDVCRATLGREVLASHVEDRGIYTATLDRAVSHVGRLRISERTHGWRG